MAILCYLGLMYKMNKQFIEEILKEDVTLVAATKYVGVEEIKELYKLGVTNIGENRVDALLQKKEILKDLNITWHLIGTLQSRKTKEIINEIDYLHSLDSLRLAKEIEKYRKEILPCFIEVNISGEETKHGLKKGELLDFVDKIKDFKKIKIVGLMTMAPNTTSIDVIFEVFDSLRMLKEEIEKKNIIYAPCHYLSMGMSNDYKIALKCGSTHLRLGHILF